MTYSAFLFPLPLHIFKIHSWQPSCGVLARFSKLVCYYFLPRAKRECLVHGQLDTSCLRQNSHSSGFQPVALSGLSFCLLSLKPLCNLHYRLDCPFYTVMEGFLANFKCSNRLMSKLRSRTAVAYVMKYQNKKAVVVV